MYKRQVGHEVGHIIAGHKASHYEQNNDTVRPFSRASVDRENEADAMFTSAIRFGVSSGSISEDIEENLSSFLLKYMEIQYANEVGDNLQAGPMQFISEVPFKKSDASTHAEYFIRAGRMLTHTKHDMKDLFVQTMPVMEAEYYKRDLKSGGKLVISGQPENAYVSLVFGNALNGFFIHRRAPIRVWIPPNQYQANISLPGYLDKVIGFSVEPGQVTKLYFEMDKDSDYPHHLDKKYEDVVNASVSYFIIDYPFSENADADSLNNVAAKLRKIIIENSEWSTPRLSLALLYLEQMDCESAIDLWSTGIKMSLASNGLYSSEIPIAIDIIEHRLSKNPSNEYLVLDLIRLYADVEDYNKSHELAVERLSSQGSDRIVGYYKFLHLWKNEKKYSEALKVITDLIDGGDEIYFNEFYIANSLDLLLAELSEEVLDYETAEHIYSSWQNIYGDILFQFYLRQQRFDLAESLLLSSDENELDRTYPKELLCDLTASLFSAGEQDWASKLFDQYNLETTSANCLIAAGRSHIEKGKIDQALELCGRANAFDSVEEKIDALECIADAKDANQLRAEALQVKNEALWLDPLNPLLLEEVAIRNESVGNSEKASCYRQLLGVYNSVY